MENERIGGRPSWARRMINELRWRSLTAAEVMDLLETIVPAMTDAERAVLDRDMMVWQSFARNSRRRPV